MSLTLTAPGGLRTCSARMATATVADALKHQLGYGGKDTIDSATPFNKALEVIEALAV